MLERRKGGIMSLSTVLPLVALVVVIGLIVWLLSRPRRTVDADPEIVAIDKEREALLSKFYAATSNGESVHQVARIYSQTDKAEIESLLCSEGIALVQVNSAMNVLRTGVPIQGLNDCIFSVLERDYEKAREIVLYYISSLDDEGHQNSAATVARNVAETAIGGTLVNASVGRPEIL
jgi:hypothetical protein